MGYKLRSLSGGQTMLITFGLFQLAMILGLIFSTNNLNHPFWIVTGFFAVNVFLRGVTFDFRDQSDAELKRRFVFGVLKMLTGSLLLAGAILSSGGVVLLGLGFAAVFLVLGCRDVFLGAALLNEKLVEREAMRRVLNRKREEATQHRRAIFMRMLQEAEQDKAEEALINDLTDFIASAGDSPDGEEKIV